MRLSNADVPHYLAKPTSFFKMAAITLQQSLILLRQFDTWLNLLAILGRNLIILSACLSIKSSPIRDLSPAKRAPREIIIFRLSVSINLWFPWQQSSSNDISQSHLGDKFIENTLQYNHLQLVFDPGLAGGCLSSLRIICPFQHNGGFRKRVRQSPVLYHIYELWLPYTPAAESGSSLFLRR